jgi:predicted phosphoribosyltransferase
VHYRDRPDVIVLGLPRGGVPVAYEVAKALDAPLDLFLVRKLGVPGHEELAMGAAADGNVLIKNQDLVDLLNIPDDVIARKAREEQRELNRQRALYRTNAQSPKVKDHIVILVDDGLATGSTMRAAVRALQQQRPKRLVVAVPVGAPEVCAELNNEVDETVCAVTPRRFVAVGIWYEDFSPTSDAAVRALLHQATQWRHAHA